MKLLESVAVLSCAWMLASGCGGGDSSPEAFCKEGIRAGCQKASECGALTEGATVQDCIDQTMAMLDNCQNAEWNCPEASSGADACLAALRAQSCEDFNSGVTPQECELCPGG